MKRVMIHTGSITDVVATRLDLTEWGDVYTDSGIRDHITKNHSHELKKEILEDPFELIRKVIDGPDYIGKHPKHGGIEMVRNVDGQHYQVGIKYNYSRGYYFVATMHPVEHYKIKKRLGERLQEINTKGEMRMSNESKEYMERIEKGMMDYLASDKFKDYLKFQSRFHNYSLNNTWLIMLQKPDATRVAGFKTWKDLGRFPGKGTGIKILAPRPYTFEKEVEVVKDGKKIKEMQKVQGLKFEPVHVFDVSDTKGRDLPTLIDELRGSSQQASRIIDGIKSISKIPITYEPMTGKKGYYSPLENRIAISDSLDMNQEAKTLVHEHAHARMHNPDQIEIASIGKRMCEVQAECVAFIVCERFGLDTSDYSFGYMATYSSSMEFPELKESFALINKTAGEIINEMENALTKTNENVIEVKREAADRILVDELTGLGLPRDSAEKCAVAIRDAMDAKIPVIDKTLRVDDMTMTVNRMLVRDDEGIIAAYGTVKDIDVNGQKIDGQITWEAYDHRKSLITANDAPIKIMIDSCESSIFWNKVEGWLGKPIMNDLRKSIMLDYETANRLMTETHAETIALKRVGEVLDHSKALPSGKMVETISFKVISPLVDHEKTISYDFGSKEACDEPEKVSLKSMLAKEGVDLSLKSNPSVKEAKAEFMSMINSIIRQSSKGELETIGAAINTGELFSTFPKSLKERMVEHLQNQQGIRDAYIKVGDSGKEGSVLASLKSAERYYEKHIPAIEAFLDDAKNKCIGMKPADAKGILKQIESGKLFKSFPDNFIKEFKEVLESLGGKTATGSLDKKTLETFKNVEKDAYEAIHKSVIRQYEKELPSIRNITPSAALSIYATNCSVNAVVTVAGFEKMHQDVAKALTIEPTPEGKMLMNHLTSVVESLRQCKEAEQQVNNQKVKVIEEELELG